MKKPLPQVRFIYSLPYDRLLTECQGQLFGVKQKDEVLNCIRKLQTEWNKINDKVFQELKKSLSYKFSVREIKCYVEKIHFIPEFLVL